MNTILLIIGAALIGALILFQVIRRVNVRKLVRFSRYAVGGILAALTALLLMRGQIMLASFTGPAAFVILRYGRLGRFSFESTTPSDDNASEVKSRFIRMKLDHDTGTVEGRVVAGAFRGVDLIELGELETRQLLAEVANDTDSLALLETWLDKNRSGWREYFAEQDSEAESGGWSSGVTVDPDAEAYEVLGLGPDATAEEIRAAHHKLMKGVHPDQGGSNYLASRINAAKDRLLRKVKR